MSELPEPFYAADVACSVQAVIVCDAGHNHGVTGLRFEYRAKPGPGAVPVEVHVVFTDDANVPAARWRVSRAILERAFEEGKFSGYGDFTCKVLSHDRVSLRFANTNPKLDQAYLIVPRSRVRSFLRKTQQWVADEAHECNVMEGVIDAALEKILSR